MVAVNAIIDKYGSLNLPDWLPRRPADDEQEAQEAEPELSQQSHLSAEQSPVTEQKAGGKTGGKAGGTGGKKSPKQIKKKEKAEKVAAKQQPKEPKQATATLKHQLQRNASATPPAAKRIRLTLKSPGADGPGSEMCETWPVMLTIPCLVLKPGAELKPGDSGDTSLTVAKDEKQIFSYEAWKTSQKTEAAKAQITNDALEKMWASESGSAVVSFKKPIRKGAYNLKHLRA